MKGRETEVERALCAAAALFLHVVLVSLWLAAHAESPRTSKVSGDGASPAALTVLLIGRTSSSEALRAEAPREVVRLADPGAGSISISGPRWTEEHMISPPLQSVALTEPNTLADDKQRANYLAHVAARIIERGIGQRSLSLKTPPRPLRRSSDTKRER